MKKHLLLLVILFLGWSSKQSFAGSGEETFKSNCASCHSIGNGQLVGPDLKGVNDKYDEAWLIKWISSSQTLVKKKDAKAVELFEKFKIAMPDFSQLSEAEIKDLLAYIKTQEPALADTKETSTTATSENTSSVTKETTKDSPVQLASGSGNTLLTFASSFILLLLLVIFVLSTSIVSLSRNLEDKFKNEK